MKNTRSKAKQTEGMRSLRRRIKSEVFKAGVHDFVQKPHDPNEALKKVRESIDRK